jgi:signal transduction histidine kinase
MNTTTTSTDRPVEILIAEDSPTQARRLRHILEQKGYAVTSASNGKQALEAVRSRKPTLIISDVVMPEMNGYELCRSVKTDAALNDVPIILVTTLSDPQDVIRGLECQADNFILKPYDESHLLSRVQFVLVNRDVHQMERAGMGVEIFFNGQKHFITADRLQILNLLLSTYDAAIQRNKELSRAQQELHRVNSNLEAANKELEAFTHSVSHDLRAPLRAIDGFSAMLLEDFASDIPKEAQRLLRTVCKNAEHMGQLIDDLLRLSRMGQQQLSKRKMNVNSVVHEVLKDLKKDQGERCIDVKVGDLPDCFGDLALLRQVYVNLLSNAFKYTRGKERAVIEVGCLEQGEENVYFVEDNGAGFDMRYAAKLFGVFQRFHSSQEFEGTGVGLSIVQRIIQRHGGRIWAEAEVDKGAAFYFTLPDNQLE